MQLPFSSHYHLALDLGSAWTRGAKLDGEIVSIKSERSGLRGISAGAVHHAATYAAILSDLFHQLRPSFSGRPHVVASVSSCASPEQRAAFTSAIYQGGASSVMFVAQPIAAALGAGLDPASSYAQMIIDVGEGFTEYSIISGSRVEKGATLQIGCGAIRAAIERHCSMVDGAVLTEWLESGLFDDFPEQFNPALIKEIETVLDAIAVGARGFFEPLSDAVACEVIENGVMLVGGGALLRELKRRISLQTGLAVRVPPNPLTAVVEGAKQIIPYRHFGY